MGVSTNGDLVINLGGLFLVDLFESQSDNVFHRSFLAL